MTNHYGPYRAYSCRSDEFLGESATLDGALLIAREALPKLGGLDAYVMANKAGSQYSHLLCFSDGLISEPEAFRSSECEAAYLGVE